MNLSALFIKRPVTTTLVMLALIIFGLMGYRLLPVSDLPNVDFPTISVSAGLPGASPETMAAAIATQLERQFTTIAGLDTMTSSSFLGSTQITLQFNLNRDIDAAAQDVQAAIAKVLPLLPRDMPAPPTYQKVNPADQPIIYIALTSPTLPLSTLDEYGETYLAQRISTVSGVAQVVVYGAQKFAVHAQLDPRELAARGIGINDVLLALQNGNVNLPTGTLWGSRKAITVEATGQLEHAAEFRPLIVAYRNGAPVRLGDLGRIIDGVENDKVAAWFNTPTTESRAVVLAVQKQPGTNTVAVASEIRRNIPLYERTLPASVSLNVLFDRSTSIRNSVNDVQFTLLLTLALVVMVIFLFLRNLSATVIPSLALPMSIVATFAAMYLLGYSLDNLSLMALTLSVGFVVDDAIVMLENIVRHMEMGQSAWEAALEGSREIGFTIVSMTLSLAAVFIPVLFMGGIVGRLFREFAVTIGLAVLISGVVSLTLTPMLCSRFLRPSREAHHGRLYAASESVFNGMLKFYERTLAWALRHRRSVMAFSAVVVALMVFVWTLVPKGFIPSEDTGQLFCPTEAAEGASFDAMVNYTRRLAEVARQNPNVEAFMAAAGGGAAARGANTGTLFLRLKPRSERDETADQVVQDLRAAFAQIPGIRAYPQNPPSIRVGGRFTNQLYQFTLQGADTGELFRVAPLLEARMRALPILQDVVSDLRLRNPELLLDIQRDKASALGLSADDIEDALSSAYSQRQVSTIYGDINTYRVIMELLPQHQRDPSALSLLYLRSSSGELVPLDAVVKERDTLGPLSVNHSGQLPSVTISFNLRPGASLGDATAAVQRLANQYVPDTITTSFQGTAQAFQSSVQGLGMLLILAVLVIYIVLGILYESFIHPLTILSALPFAGFGALVTLFLFRTELSIYAFVGVIMLVGLVKKNGIMMVDFALEGRRRGKDAPDAIYEACRIRFRPIMMTTMAALMATLPIALGFGAGAEVRRPLGLSVVGGLLFSQFLTLYVTPVVYVYMDHFQGWLGRVFGRPRAAQEGAPA